MRTYKRIFEINPDHFSEVRDMVADIGDVTFRPVRNGDKNVYVLEGDVLFYKSDIDDLVDAYALD